MFQNLIQNIQKTVIGNEFKIKISIATILSGGHILIEDLPGTGKQLLQNLTSAMNLKLKEYNLLQIYYQVTLLGILF